MIATLIAWAKSLMPKPADRNEIARWVEQNMPGNQIEKLEQNEDKS